MNKILGGWVNKYMELQESLSTDEKPLCKNSYDEIKELVKDTQKINLKESSLKQIFKKSPLKKSFSMRGMGYIKPSGDKSPI